MLVLSRKQGEGIVIDNNVVITVSSVNGGRVKLAIDAPGHKSIYRQEVWLELQEELSTKPGDDQ